MPETVASQARRESIQRQQEEKERKEQEHLRKRPVRRPKITPDPTESEIEGHADIKSTTPPRTFDYERMNGVHFPVNSVQYQLQKARQQEAFIQRQNMEAMLLRRQQYDSARLQEKYQESTGKLVKQDSAPNVLSHDSNTSTSSDNNSNNKYLVRSSPSQEHVTITLKQLSLSNNSNFKVQNQKQKRILPVIPTSPELKSPSSDSNSYDPFQSMLQIRSMGMSNRLNR